MAPVENDLSLSVHVARRPFGVRRLSMRTRAKLVLIVPLVTLLQSGDVTAGEVVLQSRPPANSDLAQTLPVLVVGDKLRIAFYEQLQFDDDKWARQQGAPIRTLHLLAELSGEYVLQEDGAVSLPLLGRARIEGLSGSKAEEFLANLVQEKMGRSGFVNIAVLEHPPVYITGAVKNPGAYKLAPRMTIGQVIALAGGVQRGTCDAWQAIESLRENGSREQSLRRLARLFARRAVLKAERDGTKVEPPSSLAEMVGHGEAKELVAEVASVRAQIRAGRAAREASLNTAVESSKKELKASLARLEPLKASMDLRNKRFQSLNQMASAGLVKQSVSLEAQAALSDVQISFQDASIAAATAKRRLAQAIDEKTRYQTEARLELDREYQSVNDEITDSSHAAVTSGDVLGVLNPKLDTGARNSKTTVGYEIVRRNRTSKRPILAEESSKLMPGDLIRIILMNEPSAFGSETSSISAEREGLHD